MIYLDEIKARYDINDYVYEWVDETIPFETIRNWVEWEVENTFSDIRRDT